MKPYFEGGGITIYHGDCRDILPSLAGVVVTDPPFNIGYHYGRYKDKLQDDDYLELMRLTLRLPSVVIHYPEDVFRIAQHLGVAPTKCAAWVHNANTPRQWRMVAWFGVSPSFKAVRQPYKNPTDKRIKELILKGSRGSALYDWWHIEQVKNVSGEKVAHPCQMPVAVMLNVVGVTPGDVIIDPFMGSGTTLIAAKMLGRTAIGIEMDEKYCEIAAKRIERGEGS